MSTAWTAYPFKRALATAVAARSGITSLTPALVIRTDFPSLDEPITDSIVIGYRLEDQVERPTLTSDAAGPPLDEEVEVFCQVRTARPGAGETVAQLAEDRARVIIAEIDDELRGMSLSALSSTVGGQVFWARIRERSSILLDRRSGDTPMKVCLVQFRIRYRARTAP